MSDCPTPGCTWTNIYMTCQDGSREYATYQHAQTHEAGPDPVAPGLHAILHDLWLRIHTRRFDGAQPNSFYNGITKAEQVVHEVAAEHGIDYLDLREGPRSTRPTPPAEKVAARVTSVELHCDDCQQPYGVWFAENEVWNYVVGGPEAKGDPGGMLCPRCFTVRAEAAYGQRAIWRLTLDNAARPIPPANTPDGGR